MQFEKEEEIQELQKEIIEEKNKIRRTIRTTFGLY